MTTYELPRSRRLGQGALAPCRADRAPREAGWWARFALPTLWLNIFVTASEAKQSILLEAKKLNCFVAALLAMTAANSRQPWTHLRVLATGSVRVIGKILRSLEMRARGNAGCQAHPQPRVHWGSKKAHEYSQRGRRNRPAFPHAMVLRLIRTLPGDRAFLPPSPAEVAFHKLDASVEASGPHDFAVRFQAARHRPIHVHRIPRSTSVTIAIRPSSEAGRRQDAGDLGRAETTIFFRAGLDR
jgi:hypothetical protein